MKQRLIGYGIDTLMLVGIGGCGYGAYQLGPPGGFVVGGFLCMILSVGLGMRYAGK